MKSNRMLAILVLGSVPVVINVQQVSAQVTDCTGQPVGTDCNDGTICTRDDKCDSNEMCTGEVDETRDNDPCEQSDPLEVCTQDRCIIGTCVLFDQDMTTGCGPLGMECVRDVCNGSGGCGVNKALDVVWSDQGECVRNVCDGAGTCGVNEAAGTACEDPATGPCTIDTCDANGNCANHAPRGMGTACTPTKPQGNNCTLDRCNEAGDCEAICELVDECDVDASTPGNCLVRAGQDPPADALRKGSATVRTAPAPTT